MTEEGGEPRPPWHRNPWVWGVIAGLVLVPAVRPFTRKVPDAPEVLAPLPEFSFETAAGSRFGSRELRGEVYVLAVGSTTCSSICSEVFVRAEWLSDRFHAFDRGVFVVALDYGGSGRPAGSRVGGGAGQEVAPVTEPPETPPRQTAEAPPRIQPWTVLTGSRASIGLLVDQGLRPLLEVPAGAGLDEFAHLGRLFLVDHDGAIRGHYGSDEQGLDEVYHRARHVRRDYLRAHRWESQ